VAVNALLAQGRERELVSAERRLSFSKFVPDVA
jgi:hypothetical protein